MGVASDAFATAREQKHVARKLKERKQPDQKVSTAHPVRRLKRLAALLPKDVRADALAVARRGGTLSKQELEDKLFDFERKLFYVNYDWV